jgi:hypothetical protein
MRFVGIDLGLTCTGVAVMEIPFPSKGAITTHSIKYKKPKHKRGEKDTTPMIDRQKFFLREIYKLLQKGDTVVVENFAAGGRFAPSGMFIERVELLGMAKLMLPSIVENPIYLCPINTLKQFTCDKVGVHKDQIKGIIADWWMVEVANDDEADAFGLCQLGYFADIDYSAPKRNWVHPVTGMVKALTPKRIKAILDFQRYNYLEASINGFGES